MNEIIQDNSLNCADHCLQLLAKLEISKDQSHLVKALTACASACLAAGRGCFTGTCLPQNVEHCHDHCVALLSELESAKEPADYIETCRVACQECIDATAKNWS